MTTISFQIADITPEEADQIVARMVEDLQDHGLSLTDYFIVTER